MAVFRVEKNKNYTVMSNYHLRDMSLSLKAKGLLSLMLSLPETWDYTLKGLSRICKDGIDSVTKAVHELESAGYVTKERIRNELGQLKGAEYVIHEQPVVDNGDGDHKRNDKSSFNRDSLNHDSVNHDSLKSISPKSCLLIPDSPKSENPILWNPILEKPKQENPRLGKPNQENPRQLNTYISSKDKLNTESINPINPINPDGCNYVTDTMRYEQINQTVKGNIDYDMLIQDVANKEIINELVSLCVEVIVSKSESIYIARQKLPIQLVKKRFLQLRYEHVVYVLDKLSEVGNVKNIKAYLLTMLFNATSTLDSYIRTEVNQL